MEENEKREALIRGSTAPRPREGSLTIQEGERLKGVNRAKGAHGDQLGVFQTKLGQAPWCCLVAGGLVDEAKSPQIANLQWSVSMVLNPGIHPQGSRLGGAGECELSIVQVRF